MLTQWHFPSSGKVRIMRTWYGGGALGEEYVYARLTHTCATHADVAMPAVPEEQDLPL